MSFVMIIFLSSVLWYTAATECEHSWDPGTIPSHSIILYGQFHMLLNVDCLGSQARVFFLIYIFYYYCSVAFFFLVVSLGFDIVEIKLVGRCNFCVLKEPEKNRHGFL